SYSARYGSSSRSASSRRSQFSRRPRLRLARERAVTFAKREIEPDVVDDGFDRGVDRELGGVDDEVGLLRWLVRRRDAGEFADLAGARQLVQTLRVAALANRQRSLDIDLAEMMAAAEA